MTTAETRTTEQVAARLYELCSANEYTQAQNELYADDAMSFEPEHAQGLETVQGKEAMVAKGQAFNEMIAEHHGGYVNKPMVFGPYIFMEIGMDVTMKDGNRITMTEMGKYVLEDGKIVSEEFFY